MLFKSKKNSPNRRKNIAKIKSPIKHSSRNKKENNLHNSLHCLTESPNISQTFHVPYTPLTRKEKIIELKQDQEESSNRLKKYSLLFNEIKNQITSINQQITQSKHIKRGSLFDFKSSKTYNPPKSLFMKFNIILAMSMLIGYIDGDGSIQQKNNKGSIRVKCHSSWFNVLNEIYIFLGINRIPIINKEGYVTLTINDKYNLSILKDHISTYNLPILNRKWDKINNIFNSSALHEITKLDISCSRGNWKSKTLREAKELKLNIINDYNNGMRNKDIANKYCISHGYVTKIIHGNN